MKSKASIDIERAIETVRLFSQPHEAQGLTTIEHFDVRDGILKAMPRSTLETTLAFTKDCIVRTFSSDKREEQEQKRIAIKGTLQKSLDLLKVYSAALIHMQNRSDIDRGLAMRVVMAASKYNAFVRQTKSSTNSLSGEIKQFFLKMAGWTIDEELIQNEIHIPETLHDSIQSSWRQHKITYQPEQSASQTALSVLQAKPQQDLSVPKREELDLFKCKAITLLQGQEKIPYTLAEILELVNHSQIGYRLLKNEAVIELSQNISNFPGLEIELKGAFQRESAYPDLAIPIKESFAVTSFRFPSGFPHPLQYTGIALHEKLFPSCLLRPQLCPALQKLIETKELISHQLRPNGMLLKKAKTLLLEKKEIARNNAALFELQKRAICSLIKCSGLDETEFLDTLFHSLGQLRWFEALAQISSDFNDRVIREPLDLLQEEWLLNESPDIRQAPHSSSTRLILDSIFKAKVELAGPFSPNIVEAIGRAAMNIHLLQLSEHLNFEPPTLTDFETKLLVFLFRQQLIFAHELQKLDARELRAHLAQTIEEDIALFENTPTNDPHTSHALALTQELISYYTLRYRGAVASSDDKRSFV